ncbi:DoxX family protein [soil metagenome]
MPLDTPYTEQPSAMTWTGRVMSGVVILFLLFDGAIKLVPLDIVIETSKQLGLSEGLARPLGVITLLCTILYAMPRTSILGAVLLTAYMGGAVATHVRIGSPLFSHTLFGVYLGLLIWGGLYFRDHRIRTLLPLRR